MSTPKSLDDLFREEEEAALARTREDMRKEQAQWDALPQAERDRINAERDARIENMFVVDDNESEDDDDDEEETW